MTNYFIIGKKSYKMLARYNAIKNFSVSVPTKITDIESDKLNSVIDYAITNLYADSKKIGAMVIYESENSILKYRCW